MQHLTLNFITLRTVSENKRVLYINGHSVIETENGPKPLLS